MVLKFTLAASVMLLTLVQCRPASTDVLIWPLVLAVQIAPRFAVDNTKSTMDAPPPRPPPAAGAAGAPAAGAGGAGGGAPQASGLSALAVVRSGLTAFHVLAPSRVTSRHWYPTYIAV